MNLRENIVLASSSPSRKMLFKNLGIPFTVHVSGVDETVPKDLTPAEQVEILAKRKLDAVKGEHVGSVIIAADSLIALGERTLGKPETEEKAKEMLRELSGKTHHVITGVCIAYLDKEVVFSRATEVEFYELTNQEIDEYVAAGESMGRAGSYGIEGQGALLIKSITGDYANVVGIPLAETFRRIRRLL